MVIINKYENVCTVENGDEKIDALLYNTLKKKLENAFYSPAYRNNQWDGIYRFYSTRMKSFPIGLLPDAIKLFNKFKIEHTIIDQRKKITKNCGFKTDIELRPYQKYAFNTIKDEEIGIIGLPVNYGKSYLAMKLIEYKDVPTIWIVRTRVLANQIGNDFKEHFNSDIGLIGSGVYVIKPITVALIQSLTNMYNIEEINQYFDLCIFDEVHGSSAKTYKKFLNRLRTYYRFGLSGTPKKRDSVSVYTAKSLFGDVIINASQKTLVSMGVSAKPIIQMKRFTFTGIDSSTVGDYTTFYNNVVIPNEARNDMISRIVFKLLEHNLNTLLITEKVKHGIILHEMIPESIFISGQSTKKQIAEALDKFESGECKVLITTTILDEGVNLHSIDALVLAGAGINPVKTIQRVGRAIRQRVGKKSALIVDIYDEGEAILERQAKKRKSIYYQEFGNVKLID